jgi:hypothetical protein
MGLCGVCQDEMGMELGIEGTAGVMGKSRPAKVPGQFTPPSRCGVGLTRRELFQFL